MIGREAVLAARRKFSPWLALALVLAAVVANCLPFGLWAWDVEIRRPYEAQSGLAWSVKTRQIKPPLRWLTASDSDGLAVPNGAKYTLADAAGPLGPAHARHAEIRDLGEGRYSFWNGGLLFSTRHGEDPNVAPIDLSLTAIVVLTWPIRLVVTLLGALAARFLFFKFRPVLDDNSLVGRGRRWLNGNTIARRLSAPLFYPCATMELALALSVLDRPSIGRSEAGAGKFSGFVPIGSAWFLLAIGGFALMAIRSFRFGLAPTIAQPDSEP
jgi:hypothetical protein